MRRRTVGLIAAVLVVFLRGPSLYGQTIRIRVLNGHNGRPIRGEQLNVWFLKEPLEIVPFIYRIGASLILPATGKDGTAVLQVRDAAASLGIGSDFYIDCRPYHKNSSGWPAYSVAKILTEGLILENTCGKARAVSKAGELVFYVRPWHWWERLLHPP